MTAIPACPTPPSWCRRTSTSTSDGQYDAESGLHYNRHRYYAPDVGRYISADPIGQFGSGLHHETALVSPSIAPVPNDQFTASFRQIEALGPFDPLGNTYVYASVNPMNASDPFGLFTVSVGVTVGVGGGGVGGGGGTFVNFGVDPNKGLFGGGFSFSVTGTAGGGASAVMGAGLGATLMVTNACNVSGLLSTAYEGTLSGTPRGTIGGVTNGQVSGVIATAGIAGTGPWNGSPTPGATGTVSTTTALVQYSNGNWSVGDTGKGALWSQK